MRVPGTDNDEEASFDLTPMIDVILLLIIFFMLSSQFAQSELRPVDLPRETGQKSASPTATKVVIDMDREGRLSVLGRAVDLEDLDTVISVPEAAPDDSAEIDVIVRADRGGSAASLNRLSEALVAMGIGRWRLATNPQGGSSGGSSGGAP
jgi:biopolymer transport protein ExbD